MLYNNWLLENVRGSHAKEFKGDGKHDSETPVEKVKRKARESALEPGSVV